MKRVRFASVKPLWETNRWDGPLSGFCTYRGQPFYFNAWNCDGAEETRMYHLHPLSPEAFAYHEARHFEFRRYVGEHCDYVHGFRRVDKHYVDKGTSQEFYSKHTATSTPAEFEPKLNPATRYFYSPEND